jgi:AraC-like DNA-binding protein
VCYNCGMLISTKNPLPKDDVIASSTVPGYLKNSKARANSPISIGQFLPDGMQGWAEGRWDSWVHSEGCLVGCRDLKIYKDFAAGSRLSNQLSLEFVLSGRVELDMSGHKTSNMGLPRVYLSSYLDDGWQTRFYKQGDTIRSVGLWLPTDFLRKDFCIEPNQLPPNIGSILRLEREATVVLPATAKVQSTASDILDHEFEGALAEQFVFAKVTELLCYFSALLTSPEENFEKDNQLSRHKSQAVSTVLQTINNNLASPPSVDELARTANLSRAALSVTFRQSYGLSIADYLLQKRMEAAYDLLTMGKLSVLEVAIAVGYQDQSAFGRAYKRYHKHPPRDDMPRR